MTISLHPSMHSLFCLMAMETSSAFPELNYYQWYLASKEITQEHNKEIVKGIHETYFLYNFPGFRFRAHVFQISKV